MILTNNVKSNNMRLEVNVREKGTSQLRLFPFFVAFLLTTSYWTC